jgi:hypothetical protein
MRLLRVAGVLLAMGLAVAGCGDKAVSSPVAVTPTWTPTSTTTGTRTAEPARTPIDPQAVGGGSDGLTVRYADGDGRVKTLRVEDFPR